MTRYRWLDGQVFPLPLFGFRICLSVRGVIGRGEERAYWFLNAYFVVPKPKISW
jgi:hypothetical protein